MSGRRSTRGSSSSHAPSEVDSEEERIQESLESLQQKTVISTPTFNFEHFDEMGILEEFNRLTSRVGFQDTFWNITREYQACASLTKEFLASLIITTHHGEPKAIRFRLRGVVYKKSLRTLRRWFGFADPDTQHLGYLPEDQTDHEDPAIRAQRRREFWPFLSGCPVPDVANPDLTVKGIVHPVLRCICRCMGSSLFARGESSYRPMHEELELIATMLRPDDQFQRPDLMLAMVRFWVNIRHSGKPSGVIAMGSYVTFIASRFGIDLRKASFAGAPRAVDRDQLLRWQWISVSRTHPRVISWLTPMHGTYVMPIPVPSLSFTDRSTWLLPPHSLLQYPGGAMGPHVPPPQQQAEPMDTDIPGPSQHGSAGPHRYHTRQRSHPAAAAAQEASSSAGPQPTQFHIPEWQWNVMYQNTRDTYRRVEEIQQQQLQQAEQIRALQEARASDRAYMKQMRDDLFFCFRELQFDREDVGSPYDDYDPYAGFAASDFDDDDGGAGDAPADGAEH